MFELSVPWVSVFALTDPYCFHLPPSTLFLFLLACLLVICMEPGVCWQSGPKMFLVLVGNSKYPVTSQTLAAREQLISSKTRPGFQMFFLMGFLISDREPSLGEDSLYLLKGPCLVMTSKDHPCRVRSESLGSGFCFAI